MIVSIKKKLTKYHPEAMHVAQMIQEWLIEQGYIVSEDPNRVDKALYRELLQDFARHHKKYDKYKHYHIEQKEGLIVEFWEDFQKYCKSYFKAN